MNDGSAAGAERFTPASAQWRSVASEMQAIFGAGVAERPHSRAPVALVAPAGVTWRGKARGVILPVVGLTCLAGAAAGMIVVAPLRQPAASGSEKMIVSRPSIGALTPSSPIAMAVLPGAGTSPAFAGPEDKDSSSSLAPTHISEARVQSAIARPASIDVASRYTRNGETGCSEADDAGYVACSRADVIAADRDLRLAYDRAIDAGVDHGRLVAIRNRWARLRASEYDRPVELLADYAELADRLDRAADDAGDLH